MLEGTACQHGRREIHESKALSFFQSSHWQDEELGCLLISNTTALSQQRALKDLQPPQVLK